MSFRLFTMVMVGPEMGLAAQATPKYSPEMVPTSTALAPRKVA